MILMFSSILWLEASDLFNNVQPWVREHPLGLDMTIVSEGWLSALLCTVEQALIPFQLDVRRKSRTLRKDENIPCDN